MRTFNPEENTLLIKLGRMLLCRLQHWNPQKYWKRREYVVNPHQGNILLKLYYLYWIKKIDTIHNCSFGTNLNGGAIFSSPPLLPHGPNGIIVGHSVKIGIQCTIYQQVTIAAGSIIKDHVLIGAGAKILGKKLGNNVKVGANSVVIEDIPDNATVVLTKPRIIPNIKS